MASIICRKFARNISFLRTLRDSLREPLVSKKLTAEEEKYEKTALIWKRILFFICVPALGLSTVNVLLQEERQRHEFKPYEHLRIRTKKFPWGDGNKTLFHNPHRNALPDGYETAE